MKFHRGAQLLLLPLLLLQTPAFAAKKGYVVYLGSHSHGSPEAALLAQKNVERSHANLLGSVLKSKKKAKDAIIYSYTKHINGFAAMLEEEEAEELKKYPGVISVFPDREYKLHTTRSWDFMNLERDGVPESSLWTRARFGEDTIIGNLDTGVWPESESFRDEASGDVGFGAIPSKWRGTCQDDTGGAKTKFACNRKLIGARYFASGFLMYGGQLNKSELSPRDTIGHGTHTLSTAGGNFVSNASVFGYGSGVAKGGSPGARVVAYKVCWGEGCFGVDILMAFDQAIHDGVDVLSVSLGGQAVDYLEDGIAIGAFHAVMNQVTVVCSAGNSGPEPWTVSNTAPWILTVGASTMDRKFPSYLFYDDDKVIMGESLSAKFLKCDEWYPIINAADATAPNALREEAQLCLLDSLDPEKVKGKIVVCLRGASARVEKGEAVRLAGGVGMVLANDFLTNDETIADAHVLPATHITYADGRKLLSYLSTAKSPMGYISRPKTRNGVQPAPAMASFSSQGPNPVNPEILKPDVTAPGVTVIAAYSMATSPTGMPFDQRRIPFSVLSGTSMSCPHAAGVVGLLKTLHPAWSPAMIKSAIMTTAKTHDNTMVPMKNASLMVATPFSYGSGHVWPNSDMDPGLVYDSTVDDYLNFLCGVGYASSQLGTFTDENYTCPSKPLKPEDFNYPSITVAKLSCSKTVKRTVTNVGPPSTYTVRVDEPQGVSVTVNPNTMEFEKFGEEQTFEVTFEVQESGAAKGYAFGSLVWSDGEHNVRSPLVVNLV